MEKNKLNELKNLLQEGFDLYLKYVSIEDKISSLITPKNENVDVRVTYDKSDGWSVDEVDEETGEVYNYTIEEYF